MSASRFSAARSIWPRSRDTPSDVSVSAGSRMRPTSSFDERGVVEDDREQVVEVVGDAAGELAEALEPLRLVQLALVALALGLGPQPFGLGLHLEPLGHVADRGGDEHARPRSRVR